MWTASSSTKENRKKQELYKNYTGYDTRGLLIRKHPGVCVFGRRHAKAALEVPREVGKIVETGLDGGLGHGQLFNLKQILCTLQTGIKQLGLRGTVEEKLIIMVELADAQIGEGGHRGGGPVSVDVGQNLCAGLLELRVERAGCGRILPADMVLSG